MSRSRSKKVQKEIRDRTRFFDFKSKELLKDLGLERTCENIKNVKGLLEDMYSRGYDSRWIKETKRHNNSKKSRSPSSTGFITPSPVFATPIKSSMIKSRKKK